MKSREQLLPLDHSEHVNWAAVEQFLRRHISGLPGEPMQVTPFTAGYSNITYLIQIGEWEAVLRRPPFGYIPPKAHDMEREYRILQKMNPVFPLAPQPYVFSDDRAIMDKHFYVMERKKGVVLDDRLPASFETIAEVGRIVSETVVDTIVRLHAIDYQHAGLADIGKPDGYLERQVQGWIKRYHNAKTDDIDQVDEVEKWLLANIPRSPQPTIVHNDFKVNNMMLSPTDPGKAVGVLDWEMCTIGDPLSDVGIALAYWTEAGEAETGLTSITTNPGFMKRREFAERYAAQSGRDLSDIHYYLTYAFYKNAVILQQIYKRWKLGESKDERFSRLLTGIRNLLAQAVKAKRKQLV
ncbi:phosphotransferase family protein [Brevibacillus sp. TJ4]|uniref:phosphotransferase family protein n=1 Tax=Brevibacillus sp. TJ4 TaxID=3234853 RepID=UPI0037D507B8